MADSREPKRVSRRVFLKEASLAAGGAGLFSMEFIAGCNNTAETTSSATPVTGVPEDLLYSIEHVWVMEESGGIARLGITEKLWNMITNMGKAGVKVIEPIAPDSQLNRNEIFAVVETSKMTIDLFSPLTGKVVENNKGLLTSRNVYGNGWILRIKMDKPDEMDELLSHDDYLNHMTDDY